MLAVNQNRAIVTKQAKPLGALQKEHILTPEHERMVAAIPNRLSLISTNDITSELHDFSTFRSCLAADCVRATSAVLDDELICLDPDGGSNSYGLFVRRAWPHVMAFDLLAVDGGP